MRPGASDLTEVKSCCLRSLGGQAWGVGSRGVWTLGMGGAARVRGQMLGESERGQEPFGLEPSPRPGATDGASESGARCPVRAAA